MGTLKEILYDYAYSKGGGLPLTPQEMCNAVVQWVQQYLNDKKYVQELLNQDNLVTLEKTTNDNGTVIYNVNLDIAHLATELNNQFTADNFLDAFTLNEKIVGSDSVVVGISADNKKLVIKLSQTLSDTIQRLDEKAILKPDSVSEDSVPVVGSTGVVNYKPVSELGGGGGGGNIYLHRINMSDGEGFYFIYIYLSTETELTSLEQLKHYNFTRIPCSGVYETGSFVGSAEILLNGIKLYGIRINNNNPPDIVGQNGKLITIISFNDFVTQM